MPGSKQHVLDYHDAVVYPSDLALLDSPTAWLNDACINFQMTRLQWTQEERRREAAARRRPGEGESESKGNKRRKNGGDDDGCGVAGVAGLDDVFLDPSVVSFLVHQLPEDDEDYDDELLNLNASWKLPRPPTDNCIRVAKLESIPKSGVSREHRRKRIFVPISDQFGAGRAAFAKPGGGAHWSLLLWEMGTFPCTESESVKVGVGFYHFDSSSGCNASAARAVAKKLHQVLCASIPKRDGTDEAVDVIECQTPQQRNGYDCGVLSLGFAEALSALDLEHGVVLSEYESCVQSYFDENGGHEGFALGLRKRIAGDIRTLAK